MNNVKTKLYYMYPECPHMVRIKSEALCLDHIFDPWSSNAPLTIGAVIELASQPYIDQVMMYLTEDNGAFILLSEDGSDNLKKSLVLGWVDASLFIVENEETPFN